MKWTKEVPKTSAYYWAKPKGQDMWLDACPEIVYLYFDGHWSVYRPGLKEHFSVSSIAEWSDEYIPILEFEEEL